MAFVPFAATAHWLAIVFIEVLGSTAAEAILAAVVDRQQGLTSQIRAVS